MKVERVTLCVHAAQLLLNRDGLVQLLEKFCLGRVSCGLREHLMEGLHLSLDLATQLLLLLLKRAIFGVMLRELVLVLGEDFFLGLLVREGRHEVLSGVGLLEHL